MTKTQKRINNLIGLIIGIVASAVYIMTAEPTVSWWDCGEYIATTSKMLIGHPPGAPTFQIIGRIATLFAGDDVTKMAFCVNCMSAICSGMTIMLLYFSLVRLARKLVAKWGEINTPRFIAILGTAIVGALTYTFSDTFWFSAVEGEVYAMSSFFTALVFWCILKWDEEYEHPKDNVNPNRWIVLIAYLVGLSIGVHLLNLLTLPAIGLIIYYRLSPKATGMGAVLAFALMSFAFGIFCSPIWMILIWLFVTTPLLIFCGKRGALTSKAEWGVSLSLLVSVALLGFILWGVVPQLVNLAGKFDLFFVNTLHMPFNSGVIFFFLLIAALIGWAMWYGHKRNKPVYTISAFSLMMLIIGYSTFMTLVIRSNANPTIDENSPEDAVSLLSYLNREQYGSNPLVYGQCYNTRVIGSKDGSPVYYRNEETKRYEVSNPRKGDIPEYDPKGCMFFPRMWSSEKQSQYIDWLNNRYNSDSPSDKENRKSLARGNMPTWQQNLKFFHTYQLGYMYWRYFMWNFSGRQNDLQGHGDYQNGNWITGIGAIDNPMVGNLKDMPAAMERPGHNKYYLLPLLLGLVGLIFQTKQDTKHSFVVFMLFVMTGLAIAIYLNMYAFQPRERDYAFAASFYAFAMWVGFGVLGIYRLFEKLQNNSIQTAGAVLTTVICVGLVPCVMAKENWHDHDRSDRYTALAVAKNYLDSCEPNAILFTLGDNDTFPLWYAQEVEGYRTDVRVCNLMLLSTSWYVDQMKRKAYESDPLPISMTWDQYKDGTRDVLYLEPAKNQYVDLKAVMDYVKSSTFDHERHIMLLNQKNGYRSNGRAIPGSFSLPVDKAKVLANGTVDAKDSALVVDKLMWNLKSNGVNPLTKAYIIMMDILVNNNWERPIYYAATAGSEAYLGLEDYFQLEGFAYRLVPIRNNSRSYGETGRINSDRLYHNLMNVFDNHSRIDRVNNPNAPAKEAYPYAWGGFNDPKVYHSEDNTRMVPLMRRLYARLAEQLIAEGDKDKALKVLVHGNEVLPDCNFPYVSVMSYIYGYTHSCMTYMEDFFRIGTPEATREGMNMANKIWNEQVELFNWYNNCDERTLNYRSEDIHYDILFLHYMMNNVKYPSNELANRYKELKIDKVADFYAKNLQSTISAQLRKADMDQQAMAGALQELHQLQEIAQIAGDNQTAQKIQGIAASQLDMISNVSRELGGAFRQFYNSLNKSESEPAEGEETAETL
jgi:MFS family permease